jgi:cytochrome b pre-mRNA-processing protein 3
MNERTGPLVNLLSRLFGKSHDLRAPVRPLWHRVVELAREREWYAECGVADTVPGRFDALALVLALVMLRMEREEALIAPSALLSEMFIEDMDGQLRQSGVGDLVVGKRIGKLMGALGGRITALREALAVTDGPLGEAALIEVAERNVTLTETGDTAKIAARLRALALCLDGLSGEDLLAGRIAP